MPFHKKILADTSWIRKRRYFHYFEAEFSSPREVFRKIKLYLENKGYKLVNYLVVTKKNNELFPYFHLRAKFVKSERGVSELPTETLLYSILAIFFGAILFIFKIAILGVPIGVFFIIPGVGTLFFKVFLLPRALKVFDIVIEGEMYKERKIFEDKLIESSICMGGIYIGADLRGRGEELLMEKYKGELVEDLYKLKRIIYETTKVKLFEEYILEKVEKELEKKKKEEERLKRIEKLMEELLR